MSESDLPFASSMKLGGSMWTQDAKKERVSSRSSRSGGILAIGDSEHYTYETKAPSQKNEDRWRHQ